MTSFFAPVKKNVEDRVLASKSREKRSLIMPMLIGSVITGCFYAFPAKAANRFNFWESAAAMAGGGLASLVCVAVQNQPGSSESLRKLVTTTDDFVDLSARLEESMQITHQKLDRQQGLDSEINKKMAGLSSSLGRTDDAIAQFSSGVFSMASGGFRHQQPASYSEPTQPHRPIVVEDELNFEEEQATPEFEKEDAWA